VLDEHLAARSYTRYTSKMRDERDALWPARLVREVCAAGDNGSQTVGANHDARATRARLPVGA